MLIEPQVGVDRPVIMAGTEPEHLPAAALEQA